MGSNILKFLGILCLWGVTLYALTAGFANALRCDASVSVPVTITMQVGGESVSAITTATACVKEVKNG